MEIVHLALRYHLVPRSGHMRYCFYNLVLALCLKKFKKVKNMKGCISFKSDDIIVGDCSACTRLSFGTSIRTHASLLLLFSPSFCLEKFKKVKNMKGCILSKNDDIIVGKCSSCSQLSFGTSIRTHASLLL